MNYGVIIGHLGADPDYRCTASGQKVTSLRVGCRSRNDTIWWRVTIWGEQFDKILSYFKKGSSIIVCGEIVKSEAFIDKEGKPQASMQMVASHLSFPPSRKDREEGHKLEENVKMDGFLSKSEIKEEVLQQVQPNVLQLDEEIPF